MSPVLVAILLGLFWLAVLVADDATRHNKNPLFWGVIVFLTGFLGAFVYLLRRPY